MARKGPGYRCSECGASFSRWSGRCPNCRQWDSLEQLSQEAAQGRLASPKEAVAPVSLAQITPRRQFRISTGTPEFDRVLGGGILCGSAVLLGGDPGVGKSTILLQTFGRLAVQDVPALYISCEESLDQVKMRAMRVGVGDAKLKVCAEADLGAVLGLVDSEQPLLLAVDSIQRLNAADVDSPAGSLKQVSLCAQALTEKCKEAGAALFLVGHVTKQGYIAGPRALEHLVDTVLYFESEKGHSMRILRATKNRFGAVNEIGVFRMDADGLHEVSNPSRLFLAERDPEASGSVVTAAMEGSRALLVEIQALVGPGSYGTPERKATGIDYRRFSMMMSVMERKAGLELGRSDAFVNVAGGVRVNEPAADLPLALALASSLLDRAFHADAVAIGEVGLGGEVRTVGRMEDRLKEAAKLGFLRAVVPAASAQAARRQGLEAMCVRNLREAVHLLTSG